MTLTDIRTVSRLFALGNGSDSSFTDAEILLRSNINYRKLVAMAVKFQGDWSMVGRTKLQRSITAATRTYSLPTTFLVIPKVEVKYPSNNEYELAERITDSELNGIGEDEYVTGNPKYRLYGSNIDIFVSKKTADIEAVTNGINIYYQDEITALASAGDETILPEFANDLLCMMNARDYAIANSMSERIRTLGEQIGRPPIDENNPATGEMANFLNFLEVRTAGQRPRLVKRREDYGQSGMSGGFRPSINGS